MSGLEPGTSWFRVEHAAATPSDVVFTTAKFTFPGSSYRGSKSPCSHERKDHPAERRNSKVLVRAGNDVTSRQATPLFPACTRFSETPSRQPTVERRRVASRARVHGPAATHSPIGLHNWPVMDSTRQRTPPSSTGWISVQTHREICPCNITYNQTPLSRALCGLVHSACLCGVKRTRRAGAQWQTELVCRRTDKFGFKNKNAGLRVRPGQTRALP
ncbi:Ectonucleotide pyrophosphatase/phosphodiesterase member 6 [Branchiostoma belcheri]|nr:Ectonucleotide pyrophosphatase/phosphodiesterase member 6 [Branchiostoma belcheri]